jgi:siroheme synthase-like protein
MQEDVIQRSPLSLPQEQSGCGANHLFPIFLKLDQQQVLVVGGGPVALEKIQSLLRNSPGVLISLVAPEISPGILSLQAAHPHLVLIQREFQDHDLQGKRLVLVATSNRSLNEIIRHKAKELKILVNVADTPDICDFYLGSVVIKGNLKIAISTNGKSPTVGKRIRQVLEETIPLEMDQVLEKINRIRHSMAGDFSEKVLKLDRITSVLVERKRPVSREQADMRRLLRVMAYGGIAFLLMITGYWVIGWIFSPQGWQLGNAIKVSLGPDIVYFLAGGFVAKLVDGTLGLGYGTISTAYLLSFGLMPAQVSKSVHLSEIFTSGSSGFMHLRYKNVNKKLFRKLVVPGVVGAIGGAILITRLEGSVKFIRPVIAVYTLILGINIIFKGLQLKKKRNPVKKVGLLAVIGGFLDAVAGGGWGTLVTSTLMSSGRNPVYVVGSVNLARFYVAVAGSLTFLTLLGISHWQVVVGLMVGGAVASPIAAILTRRLKSKKLLILAGIMIITLSIRIIWRIF